MIQYMPYLFLAKYQGFFSYKKSNYNQNNYFYIFLNEFKNVHTYIYINHTRPYYKMMSTFKITELKIKL